jgi:hypothetical protein
MLAESHCVVRPPGRDTHRHDQRGQPPAALVAAIAEQKARRP